MTMAHGILVHIILRHSIYTKGTAVLNHQNSYQITCQRWCLQIALRAKLHNDDEVPGKEVENEAG